MPHLDCSLRFYECLHIARNVHTQRGHASLLLHQIVASVEELAESWKGSKEAEETKCNLTERERKKNSARERGRERRRWRV